MGGPTHMAPSSSRQPCSISSNPDSAAHWHSRGLRSPPHPLEGEQLSLLGPTGLIHLMAANLFPQASCISCQCCSCLFSSTIQVSCLVAVFASSGFVRITDGLPMLS